MRKIIKKIFLVATFCLIGMLLCAPQGAAKTYKNAAQIKADIKVNVKKMNKINKAYGKAWSAYRKYSTLDKKATKGCSALILATIECRDPFIISWGGAWFRVLNPKKGTELLGTYTVVYRPAKGYYDYLGYRCENIRAVRSPYSKKMSVAKKKMDAEQKKAVKVGNKITKLKKTLSYKYKNTLKSIYVNQSVSIKPKTSYYNKLSYSSSNTSVATVTKNGELKGKSVGVTTITIKPSISKKVTKLKVSVNKKLDLSMGPITVEWYPEDDECELNLEVPSSLRTSGKISWSSSDESIADICDVDDGDAYVEILNSGTVTITCTTSIGTAKWKITIVKMSDEYDSDSAEDDEDEEYDEEYDDEYDEDEDW